MVETLLKLVPFDFRNFLKDPQAQHPPNTSCDSQVSTTIHITLPRPRRAPRQAPGLCSFLADIVGDQVDVREGLVDLQRFGEGLWPKRWQARRLTIGSTRTFVTPVINCHFTVDTNKKLKERSKDVKGCLKKVKRNKV